MRRVQSPESSSATAKFGGIRVASNVVHDYSDELSKHQVDEGHSYARSECAGHGEAMHRILGKRCIMKDSLLDIKILILDQQSMDLPCN